MAAFRPKRPIRPAIQGLKFRNTELASEIANPTLTGIRTIWNETVASGLTPQKLAVLLMDAADGDHDAYLTLAEEMEERDLHYACELGKRKLAVSRLPVTVESASDDANDVKIADAVRNMVKRAGFRWMLRDVLDALGKGFSAIEIIWDRSGSIWMPERYAYRDPRWFRWDRESLSRVRLIHETNMSEGIELPPYKFLVHMPRLKSGIPIRSGFARLAAWAYMCKGYTVKDWLAFAEIFGMPLRLGKYTSSASKDDIKILKMAVANLGTDAAGVFPEGMNIELVQAAKSSSTDFYERLAQYLDNQVTKGILGQTATTQGTPGKLGNEQAQNEVRKDIRDDDAEQLEETLQRDLIIPFVDLNFGPQEAYPQVQLFAAEKEDIAGLSDALAKLVPLGLRVEQSVIRDKLGLPDPDEDAEILLPAGFMAGSVQERVGSAQNQRFALNAEIRPNSENDEIDNTVEEALEEWEPLMKPLIDPVQQIFDESQDRDDFLRRLGEIFDKQDPSELIEHLAKMMFRARTDGIAGDQ